MKPRRLLLLGAMIILIGMIGVALYIVFSGESSKVVHKTSSTKPNVATAAKNTGKSFRLYAMGDMLAHDSVVANAKTSDGYDFRKYFSEIRSAYDDADAVFCNPETPVAGDQLGVSGYPTFNAPSAFARDLSDRTSGAGCNIINLASNHTNDKRQAGIDISRTVWQATKPLAMNGANSSSSDKEQVATFTINGLRIAFVAFADYSNDKNLTAYGLNSYHDDALVDTLMTKARASADVIIVSMHWGTEYSTVTNADQRAAAAKLASLGASVIIGTGPHVLQEITELPGRDGAKTLVYYSIGNMLSTQLEADQLTSAIVGVTIEEENGKIVSNNVTAIPTFMGYDWSPSAKAREDLLARTNLRLLPLKSADPLIKSMFGSAYSSTERLSYVQKTLGNTVSITYR